MADAYIQILPDSTGKKIDNNLLLVDSDYVYRQRVEVYAGETLPVSGPLTDTQLRATALPVSGPLTDVELRATALPVSGPLTDTQLRATAVPVSGPLTDAELRATALPVSGPLTDAELRATALPVSGPLTDAELRATALPVSGPLTDVELRATALPVSGPLTDTQLRAAAVPVSGPLTDTQLRATALPVSGPLTDTQLRAAALPVSGPLTDTQLRATAVPVTINKSFGDLTADAWGIPKVSLPHSLFHGLWTFDVPASQWFMFHGTTQVYTSTNIVSTNSAGVLTANAAQPSVTMQSRTCPRYQPNRGHLYSTALWCPSKTANGVREWGLSTTENGVFFRLKANGLLYAVLRSGSSETKEELIDTSSAAGFDVQKGNVYDIQYQWRGVGNYKFYINLVLVHTFANLGTLTALSMQNPALPATYKAVRTTADVVMHIGCVDISSENGSDNKLQKRAAYANISRNGTDIPVISIYNPLLINGQTNTRTIIPVMVSVSCDKKAVFKIWRHRDAGLLTGETFVALGNGSYVQTDSPDTVAGAVAATAATVTTMELIDAVNVQANGSDESISHDLRIDFILVRGDYFTVTATTSSGLCDVVVEWGEAV